jgi:Cys-tRNA(Pro)/Cys-tRNA(Cys) deacylase
MTPGIKIAKKNRIDYVLHEYNHDSSRPSYGAEAAEKLGMPAERVFKTLVVSLADKTLAVGVVPVCCMLNMKRIARALGAKKAAMASGTDVERSTGYVLGGVSPLGQKKRLRTVIHSSAKDYATIFVSAGRRGVEIELSPTDLMRLVGGIFADIC